MKCLLHIGTEKTGTSIVQDWLYDNQDALSRTGVYLSSNLGKPKNRLFSAYFSEGLDDWAKTKRIRNQEEKKRYFNGFIERLTEEILTARKDHNVFVITSEHLHSRVTKKEEIERLYKYLVSVFDEIKVVCYFREQYDLVVSLYSTALKIDGKASIDKFIDNAEPGSYYYNYLKAADNWAGVFGNENCIFKIYDRSKFIDNDIRLDFLNILSTDANPLMLNMERSSSNESLYLLQARAFKAVNRSIPYWQKNNGGVNQNNLSAKSQILNAASLRFGKLTSDKKELIRNRFSDSNQNFFNKYFNDDECFTGSSIHDDCTMALDVAANAVEDAFDIAFKFNREVISSLTEDQIDSLRDIALRLYNSDARGDALTLMKIALNQRPHGPLIKNKIEQWSATLNASKNR